MIAERNKYIKYILEKNIILFGAGNYAHDFYRRFKNVATIIGCMTNNMKEKTFQVDGMEICPIFRPEDFDRDSGQFIVVCAEKHVSMENQLKAMGLSYGIDFVSSDIFEILYSPKKIAIFYGVCYTRGICDCLQNSNQFTSQYVSFYWMEYLSMDALQEEIFSYLLSICDLYIYNAFLTPEKRRINQAYTYRLGKGCVTVSIPMLLFNGYYPCDEKERGKNNIYGLTSNRSPHSPFLTPDRNVNRMLEKGYSFKEIIKQISSPDFYDRDYVVANYEREMRKLELAENAADIKICDFLYKNHGKARTFLNEKHISNLVIRELANRILNKLEMEKDISGKVLEQRLLFTSEVPLYPSVIEHLSLDIYKGTYILFTFKGDMEVTFEEYIEKYYEYCMMMRHCFTCGYYPASVKG